MKINYNYIRSLARKAKRPILQYLHYNDNTITFTDSYLLLQVESKHSLTNTNISLLDYRVNTNYTPYPDVTQLMKKHYEPRQQEQIIHNDNIVYINKSQDSIFMIDSGILESIKKVLSIKEIDINSFTFFGGALKYKPNENITIIHMMKRYNND